MSPRAEQERQVATALGELVREYGAERLRDPAVLRGVLNDILGARGAELRREVELVVKAAAEGALDAANPAMSLSPAHVTNRLTSLAIDPAAAAWAVGAWSNSLGAPGPVPPGPAPFVAPMPTPPGPAPTIAAPPGPVWSVEHPAAPRRSTGKIVAAVAAVATVIAVIAGVGLTQLGGGGDAPTLVAEPLPPASPPPTSEPAAAAAPAATVPPTVAEIVPTARALRALLPEQLRLDGEYARGKRQLLALAGICGHQEVTGEVAEVGYIYDNGLDAHSRISAFTTTADARAYMARLARQVDCDHYRTKDKTYPRAQIYRPSLNDPNLQFRVRFSCTCSAGFRAERIYQVVRVRNTIALFRLNRGGYLTAKELLFVQRQLDEIEQGLNRITGTAR